MQRRCVSLFHWVVPPRPFAMKHHKCRASTLKQTKLSVTRSLSLATERSMTEACVALCLYDGRPFDVVSGLGLERIIKTTLVIGHSKGLHFVPGLLPHPTTISRNVTKVPAAVIQVISSEIVKPLVEVKHAQMALLMTADF